MVGPSRLAGLLQRHQQEAVLIEQRSGGGSTASYLTRAADVPVLRREVTQQPALAPTGGQVLRETEFTFQPTVTCLVGDRITDDVGLRWTVIASNDGKPDRHLTVVRAQYRGQP